MTLNTFANTFPKTSERVQSLLHFQWYSEKKKSEILYRRCRFTAEIMKILLTLSGSPQERPPARGQGESARSVTGHASTFFSLGALYLLAFYMVVIIQFSKSFVSFHCLLSRRGRPANSSHSDISGLREACLLLRLRLDGELTLITLKARI
jgi:hypothetical protein